MAFYKEHEEALDDNALGKLQREKLAMVLQEVRSCDGFYNRKYANLSFDPIDDCLTKLPLTTRSELQADQLAKPPYGSLLTQDRRMYVRVHQTSGSSGVPLRWLDTLKSWRWWLDCWGVIYRAAGVNADDRFFFPFSFGPFVGFWGAFESASALGNFCLPAGGMTTSARLSYMIEHGVTVVCCTPTYALRMAETAEDQGIDLRSSAVRSVIVAGEPGGHIPATRQRIEKTWGARVYDHAGMTEVGPWGFECEEAPQSLHVIESEFIAEVVDPATGDLRSNGEPGELVLTNLGRFGSPLIRYRTGDQVTLVRGRCACGRSFARVEGGVVGRFDDMLFVRGNNVFPSAVEGILREFDDVAEYRLIVDSTGSLTELQIEIELKPDAKANGSTDVKVNGSKLVMDVEAAVRDRLHFRPIVSLAPLGSLPRSEMKSKRVVFVDKIGFTD